MGLTVYSAKDYSAKLKVTIQSTGKLGFTAETAKSLQLSPETYIKIASDEDERDTLYMIICPEPDETGFKVSFVSGYYSLPTTRLFKELGIDYTNGTIIFDLIRVASLDGVAGGRVYKLDKRENRRNKKEAEM